MSTWETIGFIVFCVLASGAAISFRAARYYDGNPNAFLGLVDGVFHTPKHPYAVRAKKRAWVLMAGAIVTAAGLISYRHLIA